MSSPIFQYQIMEFQFESEMSALCSTAHCSFYGNLRVKKRIQEEAQNRGKLRAETFGSLLRTKGFVWSTFSHFFMTSVGQAGNGANVGATLKSREGCCKFRISRLQ